MRILRNTVSAAVLFGSAFSLSAYAADKMAKEDYIREAMPPGFQVVVTELEGPVFADAQGHTLYKWPKRDLRNGVAGEFQGKPTCDDKPYRENAGLMSPYPGGFELPEVDTRPGCAQVWPPAFAAADAKPVGQWSVVDRPDGRKQWAYEGWALYTSILDKESGDVNGATLMDPEADLGSSGALRRPITPQANAPAQFSIRTSMSGRSVALANGYTVYSSERDSRHKSNCTGSCLDTWQPILAAEFAHAMGEWTTFERSPGVKQWAYRGMPVYRYIPETRPYAQAGDDVPGWQSVYTQKAPPPPKGFTTKDVGLGNVLGDDRGMTVYRYNCTDDAYDQLSCDYPEAPQAYRLAICGGGDADRCLRTFPYVVAPAGAKTGNHVWGTMYVDPKTGKRAKAGDAGALNVWTYRGRPLYTFAGRNGYGDHKPGDANANSWGEWMSRRNGYLAIVYRSSIGLY